MVFIASNPLIAPEVKENPSLPISGTRGIFAKEDGWYEIDSSGNKHRLSDPKHITESEIDGFTHGFAVVSAMESKESEGGPVSTEYRYPLLAESEDLFGNVTVFQTRFFKGNWEQRVVGEEWNSLSVDLSDYVTESDLNRKLSSVYKYKGSVETVNDLPSVNEIGDVWNVKHGTVGGESLRLIPFTSIEVDVAGGYVGYYDGAKYPVISSEEEWLNVDLYDEDYNLILTSQNVTIKPEYVFSPPFDSRFLTAKYFQLTDGSNVGEVISPGLQVEAGDNVAWTGSEWDVLAGTADMSVYAIKDETYTKTEIDNMITSSGGSDSVSSSFYDIDFSKNGETLANYAGQTITNKRIRLKSEILSSSVSSGDITFQNCKIYGFGSALSVTDRKVYFKNCEVYDLYMSAWVEYDEDTMDFEKSAYLYHQNSRYYNCSFSEYWDPVFNNCILDRCNSFSAMGSTVTSNNTKYMNCDFTDVWINFIGSGNVIFENCTLSEGLRIDVLAYFTGCSGTANISSSYGHKPSTTTAFADHNFATLSVS